MLGPGGTRKHALIPNQTLTRRNQSYKSNTTLRYVLTKRPTRGVGLHTALPDTRRKCEYTMNVGHACGERWTRCYISQLRRQRCWTAASSSCWMRPSQRVRRRSGLRDRRGARSSRSPPRPGPAARRRASATPCRRPSTEPPARSQTSRSRLMLDNLCWSAVNPWRACSIPCARAERTRT